MAQTNAQRPLARVPGIVRLPGPIMRRLLAGGFQIGPNWLLTCRGRVSGEPRTQALALMEIDGHKYVIGTFGDTNWCRNLRANPEAEISLGDRHELVYARELTAAEAEAFFRDQLLPSIPSMPFLSRFVTRFFVRFVAPDITLDPATAALKRPVFDLAPREA